MIDEGKFITQPCPTCGHEMKVCALCKGHGYVSEPITIKGSSRGFGFTQKRCPNGCPPPTMIL